MKTLHDRTETKRRERAWSLAVFALYGRVCWLHLRKDPRSKMRADHAAHVIKKSRMSPPLAYGPKDGTIEPRLGRPLCWQCHSRQELGTQFEHRFSYDDVLEVTLLHNSYAVVKLPLPAREDYP
jgi:hypothetical protein